MKPPEVRLDTDGVHGFDEFERYARLNEPIWRDVLSYCAVTGCSHETAVKFIAVRQTIRARELFNQLVELHRRAGLPFTQ